MRLVKGLGRWFWGWLGFASIVFTAIPFYLWLRKVAVPDWVLLALISVLLLAVVYVFAYMRRFEKVASSPVRERSREVKPSLENMFIMVAAAEKPGIARNQLEGVFCQHFKRESAVRDFNIALGVLQAYCLVQEAAICGVEITSLGMVYLNRNGGWIKKVMKKVIAHPPEPKTRTAQE